MAKPTQLENATRRTREEIEQEISQILSSMVIDESFKRRVMNVPYLYRLSYLRSLTMPKERALSVKMKCYECMGFESVRERVGNCGTRTCPLWLHRPFQSQSVQELEEPHEP